MNHGAPAATTGAAEVPGDWDSLIAALDKIKEAGYFYAYAGQASAIYWITKEIVYVVAGRGRVWLDGVFHPVGPGSWYRIPARTPHATMADPGERMSLVCFFPHDDFANNIEELEVSLESAKEEG